MRSRHFTGTSRYSLPGSSKSERFIALPTTTTQTYVGTNMTRKLSWLLRHSAKSEGLDVDSAGFVPVAQVLAHPTIRKCIHHRSQLQRVVDVDAKGRFEIRVVDGVERIRATQGHSFGVDAEAAMVPIEYAENLVAVHGTYVRNLPSILRTGLSRMGRDHVHLVDQRDLAEWGQVRSGMRSDCNAWIYVDVSAAMRDGIPFFRSANGVVLTPGSNGAIPPSYFVHVVDPRTGKVLWPAEGSS